MLTFTKKLITISVARRLESLLLLRAKVQGSDGQKVDLVDVMPKLPRGILEDIVVRTCFVTTLPRARQLVAARTDEAGPSPPIPPPAILYPLSGNKNLTLDGSVREESSEVLFETDNEMVSLASMVLDSILAVCCNYLFWLFSIARLISLTFISHLLIAAFRWWRTWW